MTIFTFPPNLILAIRSPPQIQLTSEWETFGAGMGCLLSVCPTSNVSEVPDLNVKPAAQNVNIYPCNGYSVSGQTPP